MRIRQVKPSFWTDSKMARLSAGARLFYIGLWCLADDSGWLEWTPEEVGAQLFPHTSPTKRLREILKWGEELSEAERIQVLECGHAVIPTLSEHQRLAGPTRQVFTNQSKHERGQCPRPPAHPRVSPHIPDPVRVNGTVGERNGRGTVNGTVGAGAKRPRHPEGLNV